VDTRTNGEREGMILVLARCMRKRSCCFLLSSCSRNDRRKKPRWRCWSSGRTPPCVHFEQLVRSAWSSPVTHLCNNDSSHGRTTLFIAYGLCNTGTQLGRPVLCPWHLATTLIPPPKIRSPSFRRGNLLSLEHQRNHQSIHPLERANVQRVGSSPTFCRLKCGFRYHAASLDCLETS
jgi:hypothetical protein